MSVSYRDPAVLAFVVIPILLAIALIYAAAFAWRRSGGAQAAVLRATLATALGTAVWMSLSWLVAVSGVLRDWERRPPPFTFFIVAIPVLGCTIAYSRLGRRLARFVPLWALVGVQGFRLPLELAMHRMYERGIMPVEMSYDGRNFDIITGATAIIVAALLATGRGGRMLVWLWNVIGLALLVNVVTVAILATPAIRYFGDDQLNVWVTYPPFVWLPGVMVVAAFAGHLLIFRALRAR